MNYLVIDKNLVYRNGRKCGNNMDICDRELITLELKLIL